MQGMRFLLLGKDGKPINHGIIAQRITAEKYLCTFTRTPPVSRVCDIEEIQGWNLFPTDDALNAFIIDIQKKEAAPPTDHKKKAKKKVVKKSTKKSSGDKSNGKS